MSDLAILALFLAVASTIAMALGAVAFLAWRWSR